MLVAAEGLACTTFTRSSRLSFFFCGVLCKWKFIDLRTRMEISVSKTFVNGEEFFGFRSFFFFYATS